MPTSIFAIRSFHVLALCVLSLLAIGVLMVASASMSIVGGTVWNAQAIKHAAYAVLAAVAFFGVARFDYRLLLVETRVLRSAVAWAMVVAIAMSVAVLVIGVEVNGARRWIRFGPLQLQPSEVAKWTTVVFLAWWFAARPIAIESFFRGFCVTCIPIGAICLFTVIEDFGTAALIGVVSFLMFVVGGARLLHLAIVSPPALGAAAYFVMGTPYRWARMTSFLDPWKDARGQGYHMVQSLLSFASGGIAGRGLGNGIQKLGYLPEDTTDFVFAVVCEELGFIGALTVASMYLGVLLVAARAVRTANLDPFGKLLAFGLAATLGLQACINMAVATVSMPTKGMSLPLVSAGGTGLIITCASLGLLASVLRHRAELAPIEGSMPAFA